MAIRILPPQLVNQIAAGEVVERPASVVKELVENAIDAGATEVLVLFHQGGLGKILVRDNGCGISRDELSLAVERHATSKLPLDDALHILHLGFRGEALPAIGSIAQLTITSRQAHSETAFKIRVLGGIKTAPEPAAHPKGTSVEVMELFYATPARLKFMKTPAAEAAQIIDMLRRLALANPGISFSIRDEDGPIADYPAQQGELFSQIQARIHQVMGDEFAKSAIGVDIRRDNVHFYGAVSQPPFARGNGQMQFFTVNGRPVRDKQLLGALRAAYQDVLPQGRFPLAALYLNLPATDVDVNVHPAKAEIRLRDNAAIRSLIIGGLRGILAMEKPKPDLSAATANPPAFWTKSPMGNPAIAAVSTPHRLDYATPPAARNFHALATAEKPEAQDYPLGAAVAQIHANYILAQTANGLMLIDQHAAHERIVYEQLKAQLAAAKRKTQILLLPEIIHFTAGEDKILLARADELARIGLVLENFGRGAVLVREIPALLGQKSAADWVRDLAASLAETDGDILAEANLWKVCASLACYGSVRSGRLLSIAEMNGLLRQMEQTPNAHICNHGRPTMMELSLIEIEKLFARR
jgi:DNA mismatch repair protein MutL